MVGPAAPTPDSASPIWDDLKADLGADYVLAVSLFGPAYILLSDAIRSYNAHAYEAASAMCRATVEASCYVFLTRARRLPPNTGWSIEWPKYLDGRPRNVYIDELSRALRPKKVLTSDDFKAISRIKDNGDLSVHAAAKHDKDLNRLILDPERTGLTSGDPIRLWVSKEEAHRDIVDSALILRKLVKAAGPWAPLSPSPK
jgi:hypothetical protein